MKTKKLQLDTTENAPNKLSKLALWLQLDEKSSQFVVGGMKTPLTEAIATADSQGRFLE